jgi:hypothetical protein
MATHTARIVRFVGDGPSSSWSGGLIGRLIGTAVLGLVVGAPVACSAGRRTGSARPSVSAPAPAPSASVIDWTALPVSAVVIDGPWTALRCGVNPPTLCLRRSGDPAGAVELLTHPGVPPAGTDPIAYLTGMVAAFEKGAAANPQATCGHGYVFSAEPVQQVPVDGGVGLKSDWSAKRPDGQVVERQITYFALDGGSIVSLSATALVPEAACVQAAGTEFTPAVMAEAVPELDSVAAKSRFGAKR